MQFSNAELKSIKADISRKDISITFVVGLEQLEEAEQLANFMGPDASDMNITIEPRQLPMLDVQIKSLRHA